ncbi:MAG: Crp/Fnr family transcriptional regulator [Bacteroidetes bacterium]|nr:MAG: Crp/Fnr family transcriptional regulator [Bacteroidota bacterium]
MNLNDINCREYINNSDIFKVLSTNEKNILLKNHILSYYKRNDVIFKEGEIPNSVLCLIEGKVKISKNGIGGRSQILRMNKPIDIIGYRALIAEEPYISSAIAIEDTIICTFDKNLLKEFIHSNNDFALNIIKLLASELGVSNKKIVALTQKHIRGRFAETLLFLKNTYGFAEDNCTLNIFLSREDLANLSNMTTSNAIRTLSTFANEGVISVKGRKIAITDFKKLQRINDLG